MKQFLFSSAGSEAEKRLLFRQMQTDVPKNAEQNDSPDKKAGNEKNVTQMKERLDAVMKRMKDLQEKETTPEKTRSQIKQDGDVLQTEFEAILKKASIDEAARTAELESLLKRYSETIANHEPALKTNFLEKSKSRNDRLDTLGKTKEQEPASDNTKSDFLEKNKNRIERLQNIGKPEKQKSVAKNDFVQKSKERMERMDKIMQQSKSHADAPKIPAQETKEEKPKTTLENYKKVTTTLRKWRKTYGPDVLANKADGTTEADYKKALTDEEELIRKNEAVWSKDPDLQKSEPEQLVAVRKLIKEYDDFAAKRRDAAKEAKKLQPKPLSDSMQRHIFNTLTSERASKNIMSITEDTPFFTKAEAWELHEAANSYVRGTPFSHRIAQLEDKLRKFSALDEWAWKERTLAWDRGGKEWNFTDDNEPANTSPARFVRTLLESGTLTQADVEEYAQKIFKCSPEQAHAFYEAAAERTGYAYYKKLREPKKPAEKTLTPPFTEEPELPKNAHRGPDSVKPPEDKPFLPPIAPEEEEQKKPAPVQTESFKKIETAGKQFLESAFISVDAQFIVDHARDAKGVTPEFNDSIEEIAHRLDAFELFGALLDADNPVLSGRLNIGENKNQSALRSLRLAALSRSLRADMVADYCTRHLGMDEKMTQTAIKDLEEKIDVKLYDPRQEQQTRDPVIARVSGEWSVEQNLETIRALGSSSYYNVLDSKLFTAADRESVRAFLRSFRLKEAETVLIPDNILRMAAKMQKFQPLHTVLTLQTAEWNKDLNKWEWSDAFALNTAQQSKLAAARVALTEALLTHTLTNDDIEEYLNTEKGMTENRAAFLASLPDELEKK